MPLDPSERKALAALDPYEIRSRALDEQAPLHHLGRAIFHLNQRRGFKSNRRADSGDDEKGKIRQGTTKLYEAMEAAGARTLGEFLHGLQNRGETVRVRLKPQPAAEGKTVMGYDLYPERAMVMAEFEELWEAQARYYPEVLTPAAHDRLHDIIFFQRRLKPVRPGKCTFNPEEERLPRAHPLFQRRRIFQEANTLAIIGDDLKARPLSREERDAVALALLTTPKQTFNQLRRLLKLPRDSHFNLESEIRKELTGDETAARLAADSCFGPAWRVMSIEDQATVVTHLLEEEEEDNLIPWLMQRFKLDAERAERIANVRLPDGHGDLGLTATRKILTELEADVVQYAEAAKRAQYHHSDFRDGIIHDSLPYYGQVLDRHVGFGTGEPDDPEELRYGRLANPTVHIALGQLRRLVNGIIKRYGHPEEIIVELARELKLSKRKLDEINKELRNNTARAERHRKILSEMNLPDTGEYRMRLRLWEELNPSNALDRRCPYTGEVISAERLFSQEVEIDHILPFSKTLDNSAANRIVSLRQANKRKANRCPYEAFGRQPDWEDILGRANSLPRNKRWRFAADAMERFETKERDFIARQLTDTQYLSRLAREYLTAICNANKVWVTPGRLTEMLRRFWGLNELLPDHNLIEAQNRKNRLDHRHHAVDAVVVGVTDRALLNAVSRAAARAEEKELDRLVEQIPLPWETFRDDLRAALGPMIVSHRPDHGSAGAGNGSTAGRLHNDTAYGFAGPADARGAHLVVHRVPLESLKGAADIEKIRDPQLRAALQATTSGLTGKEFAQALNDFTKGHPQYKGIRRVRILERLNVIPIHDQQGKAYKAYKGDANHRFDIWQLPDGGWTSEVISMFDAHLMDYRSPVKQDYPTAKKVMRLHKDDLLAVELEGEVKITRVVKFSTTGTMQLAPHNEGGALKARDADPQDYFKYINTSASGLKKLRARQVRVDELGRVLDPGPRA